MVEWVLLAVVAILVVTLPLAIREGLRMEKVGELLVPTDFGFGGMKLRLAVRRQATRAGVAVHVGISATGGMGLKKLTSGEALQVATWLEAAPGRHAPSSDVAGGIEIARGAAGRDHATEFIQHSGGEVIRAALDADQALALALWLRTAAAPGRTLGEARRQMARNPS
jgi:hypothetical protein